MKTKNVIFAFIAALFVTVSFAVASCTKEEIKTASVSITPTPQQTPYCRDGHFAYWQRPNGGPVFVGCLSGVGSKFHPLAFGGAVLPITFMGPEDITPEIIANTDSCNPGAGMQFVFIQDEEIIATLYTDEAGYLDADEVGDLASGEYTVEVSLTGFKSDVLYNVTLPITSENETELYILLEKQQ